MCEIPTEVRQMVDMMSGECVIPPDRIRFASNQELSRGSAWDSCELPHNPWRKAHTENYWAWFSTEEVDTKDLAIWVQNQINVIEADSRYQAEPAKVEVDAPLALVQFSLKTRIQVLQQVQSLLKAGGQ